MISSVSSRESHDYRRGESRPRFYSIMVAVHRILLSGEGLSWLEYINFHVLLTHFFVKQEVLSVDKAKFWLKMIYLSPFDF